MLERIRDTVTVARYLLWADVIQPHLVTSRIRGSEQSLIFLLGPSGKLLFLGTRL